MRVTVLASGSSGNSILVEAERTRVLIDAGLSARELARRLERGTFAFPTASDASVVVTPTQLGMILGGLDPAKARQRPRYKTPA